MIYLDHAATTPIFPEALRAMQEWYRPENVGNPSSIHSQGVKAKRAVEHAREQVAAMIHAKPGEIFFTSGGTESNNAWLRCLITHIVDQPPLVATDALEHESVLATLDEFCNYTYVKPLRSGILDIRDLTRQLAKTHGCRHISACSTMLVNNELGSVNPISEIVNVCHDNGAIAHTDAVQAAGHIPIDVKELGVDFLSMSAHKFGGPMGVGVLYIQKDVPKKFLTSRFSWLYGGGQERGFRSGTENVPGIVGTGIAAEMVSEHLLNWMVQWKIQRQVFLNTLTRLMPGEFYCNGASGDEQADNIISLTIPGVHSEALLLMLDAEGICVSAGSACSSGELSHVLKGIGMSDADAACTIRVSLGVPTTEEELLIAAKAIARASAKIKKLNAE